MNDKILINYIIAFSYIHNVGDIGKPEHRSKKGFVWVDKKGYSAIGLNSEDVLLKLEKWFWKELKPDNENYSNIAILTIKFYEIDTI